MEFFQRNLHYWGGQGDPLSPQIFTLCIEPLAQSIQVNSLIKGLKIEDEEHKLGFYADYVILFLTDVETSLPSVLKEIELYGIMEHYYYAAQIKQI